MTAPVIRIEIEGMKHTLLTMLGDYCMREDSDIQEAIKQEVTPEKVLAIIRSSASEGIENAIKEEMRAYFQYGNGRRFVADAVKKRLDENYAAVHGE